ncbi:Mariner Mos1 transposase [Eumeta japonica]|uniref:Mariner Mos1 transposase n=1 Tax=Eumeta variegata TaxID=151549 RepID=A0A4C1SRF8_EUMVA|nr:Mariner Mos1 transposase [Eumeta japonica]
MDLLLQLQLTTWVYRDEPKPIKVERERSASKRIIATFLNKTGHLANFALENYRTVNSDRYTTICLPEVIDDLRKNNRKRPIILHHDNASSHTAKHTNIFLKEKNVELMSELAYSPDLALCDFFFAKIKNQFRGQQFSPLEEFVKEREKHFTEVTREQWHKCFRNWFFRMKKSIYANGELFEIQKFIFVHSW